MVLGGKITAMPRNKRAAKYGPFGWADNRSTDPEAKKAYNEYTRAYRRRPAVAAKMKEYRKTDAYKRTLKRFHLKKKYGISLEQFDDMFHSQGNKCAICGSAAKPKRGWHADHCHKTGRFRGVLCSGCNTGIGHFYENINSMLKAIDYLNLHNIK